MDEAVSEANAESIGQGSQESDGDLLDLLGEYLENKENENAEPESGDRVQPADPAPGEEASSHTPTSDISISELSSDVDMQDLEGQLGGDNQAEEDQEAGESEQPSADEVASDCGSSNADQRRGAASGGPRAAKMAEDVFRLPDDAGEIHFNVTSNYLRAHCAHPAHGEACRRQRTVLASEFAGRGGQGRPIGSLVSWLQRAGEARSAEEHVKMKVSPFTHRVSARDFFYGLNGGRDFARMHERKRREGEPEEPTSIP